MGTSVRIRVECPDCSEQSVSADEVTLRVCMDDAQWSYWFVCPGCARRTAALTSQAPALEAIGAGAAFQSWRLPAELREQHQGPALRLLDLVEFQLELLQTDWIDVERLEA